MKILLVVAAVLINSDGKILLAQRPEGKSLAGKWEFAGGKIEDGETPESALVRELKEELGIDVCQEDLENFWFLSHPYPEFDFHLLMPVYICRKWQGTPQPLEHSALCWSYPDKMYELDMIEADAELVERLRLL
ncbi:MAG: 8-oxo-dGTP diphosphatase MutT [Rickettsiales bacterium]|jgi:8-oxo-dGTP diphosphatase